MTAERLQLEVLSPSAMYHINYKYYVFVYVLKFEINIHYHLSNFIFLDVNIYLTLEQLYI